MKSCFGDYGHFSFCGVESCDEGKGCLREKKIRLNNMLKRFDGEKKIVKKI